MTRIQERNSEKNVIFIIVLLGEIRTICDFLEAFRRIRGTVPESLEQPALFQQYYNNIRFTRI
jgi:hypothetical protein